MKAFVLLFLVSGAALADDTAMRACRTVTEGVARLNCYDKIELGAATVARSTVPAAAAAAPALTPQQSFGLAPAALAVQARPEKIDSIDSTVVGDFDGWSAGTTFKLANGQSWKIIDGSEAILPRSSNQKVRITRNYIGTLFLTVEGSNNAAKVRRID